MTVKKIEKTNIVFLILNVFILCHPLLDILTSFATRLGFPITPGVVIRTIFMAACFIYVLFFSHFKHKKICVIYLVAVTLYCFFYLINLWNSGGLAFAFVNCRELIKTFYFPYVAVGLYAAYRHLGYRVSDKILTIVVFQYLFVILIGFITGTGFSAYSNGKGAIGWFYAGNEVSGIISILMPVALVFSYRVLTDEEKRNSLVLKIFSIAVLCLCCFGTCFVSTKVTFLAVTIFVVFCIGWGLISFLFKKTKETKMVTAISGFMCIIIIGGYFVSPLKTNIDTIMKPGLEQIQQSEEEELTKEEIESVEDYNSIVDSSIYRVANWLLSNRLYFMLPTNDAYMKSDMVTKMFGIGYKNWPNTNMNIEKAVEIDILAVFYRHGIIGFLLFYGPIIGAGVYILFRFFRRFKKNIADLSYCGWLYALGIGIGISTLTGHTLVAPAVSIYLAILMVNLLCESKSKETIKCCQVV